MTKSCLLCGTAFTTVPSRTAIGKGQYCSRKCSDGQKNRPSVVTARFLAKVDKVGPVWNGTPCWVWLGARRDQYGAFAFGNETRPAHVYAYILMRGPISEGKVLDHLCRNQICVNPDHLEAVSRGENVRRGVGKTALNGRKTHCVFGHEFTPENTYFRKGGRACRACNVIRSKRYKANDVRTLMKSHLIVSASPIAFESAGMVALCGAEVKSAVPEMMMEVLEDGLAKFSSLRDCDRCVELARADAKAQSGKRYLYAIVPGEESLRHGSQEGKNAQAESAA